MQWKDRQKQLICAVEAGETGMGQGKSTTVSQINWKKKFIREEIFGNGTELLVNDYLELFNSDGASYFL